MSETTQVVLAVAAVGVVGYFVLSKSAARPGAAPRGTAPAASSTAFISGIISGIGGLINTANKPNPNTLPAGSPAGYGSWDSTNDNLLPLAPGDTAYADDTSHDSLLS